MGQKKIKSGTSLGELLNTYTTLNYSWRHALGELVDNSIDSYLEHMKELQDGIEIRITYDHKEKRLVIADTAFGMDEESLNAAVQIGKGKSWKKGIGRYGLGLKKAATCLGDNWKIVTTRLGNKKKYTVDVDVPKLYSKQSDELVLKDTVSTEDKHGTRIEINNLRKPMRGNTEKYVKEHIVEMYRFLISDGKVKIFWNNEKLSYKKRPTKTTTEDDGTKVNWDQKITFDVKIPGTKKFEKISAEIHILETMSHTHSGLQLFWNNRMIRGGHRENWRPTALVGYPEGYKARRFCAAVHLDCLKVNHTKDDFLWRKFGTDELIQGMKDNKTIKQFLKEADKAKKEDKPDPKATAKNVQKKLTSKVVQKAVEDERKVADLEADKLDDATIEKLVEENGVIFSMDGKPFASQTIIQNEYGPILTSKVTHQNEDGLDVLRILINSGHKYYQDAINSEEEQEIWLELLQGLALTDYTLSGSEPPEFEKMIETLGKILKSFRSSDA